ncbi:MAG: FliC/FljB family flagellin [Rouxiella aceris]|uniref:FliC/FljB family flagellin n=1 Tax=Rouxiella aceris TaxID=2703884 RepID=UPI002849D90D|nr:FliC/FljB family flagellin [Rouxiella aceris]MDR3434437.1 FliC/FljB family flagellin [Rouxiella aceris]
MTMVINTNTLSLMTQQNLNKSQSALSTAIERLSSGLRINSAKDDAAGEAIANRFQSNINGLTQASSNANDGISVAQTTEGSLDEINNNLQRIRELSVQAANGTNSSSDLTSIQDEITSRLAEIDRVSGQTQFNGVNVLASNQKLSIQVGANDGQTIDIDLQQIDSSTLGLSGFSVGGSALKTSDALTSVGGTSTTAPSTVNLSAAATSLSTATGSTVAASSLSLVNLQTSTGAATAEYAVKSGDNYYAASVDTTTGNVTLNTSDVTYSDTANGVTSATQTGALVQVGADANGNATGFVTVQGKNYGAGVTGTDVLANGGATPTTTVATTGVALSGATPTTVFAGASTTDPLAKIDAAIAKVDTFRSQLGAVQNRFDSAITNLSNTTTNLQSAQSRIQDADYATEVSEMSKDQILQQAGNSVLSKANSTTQGVLTLLQNA